MNGVFALDKPAGMSSAEALNRCKRALPRRLGVKLGHAGTLDPMATGLLLVLVGEATKLQAYLMDGDKRYEAEIRFGATTDTLDADGQITEERPTDGVTEAALVAACASLVGAQAQVPPVYSAIHVDGQRSYDLARAGKAVELAARPIVIHGITVDEFRPGPPPVVRLTVDCGKGTYLRSLARDLAARLGTVGYLTALRRTRLGRFSVGEALSLSAASAMLADGKLPLGAGLLEALPALPLVELSDEAELWVRQGKSENLRHRVRTEVAQGSVVRLGRAGELVALAEQTDRGLRLLRVFVSSTPTPPGPKRPDPVEVC